MQLNRVAAVVLRQVFLISSSVTRIVPIFVWVGIDMIVWGFFSRHLGSLTVEGTPVVPLFLGAVLLWDFLVRVMQGTTMAFMEDTWSRNFLNLFASPLTIGEYALGLVLTSILTSAVGLTAMCLLATGVFGLSFLSYGALIVPFLFTLFLFGIALGITGCALMLRLGPAAEWFIWAIPAVVSPFACVFYPLATLPSWMQWLAMLMPPAHVFEGMRAVLAGGEVDVSRLFMAMGLTVVYLAVACLVFTRVYKYAVKSGLIARYSAETVS